MGIPAVPALGGRRTAGGAARGRFRHRPVPARAAPCTCGRTGLVRSRLLHWPANEITAQAITAAMVAVTYLAIVMAAMGRMARGPLDRRRLAAWEAD